MIKLTKNKARAILHDKEIRGRKLTDKQRRYFGAVASGYAQNGGWTTSNSYIPIPGIDFYPGMINGGYQGKDGGYYGMQLGGVIKPKSGFKTSSIPSGKRKEEKNEQRYKNSLNEKLKPTNIPAFNDAYDYYDRYINSDNYKRLFLRDQYFTNDNSPNEYKYPGALRRIDDYNLQDITDPQDNYQKERRSEIMNNIISKKAYLSTIPQNISIMKNNTGSRLKRTYPARKLTGYSRSKTTSTDYRDHLNTELQLDLKEINELKSRTDDVIAHELSHATNLAYVSPSFGLAAGSIPFSTRNNLIGRSKILNPNRSKSDSEIDEMSSYLLDKSFSHDNQPSEIKADLDGLRYQLYRKGIFDSTKTKEFTNKHLDAIKKSDIKDDLMFNRLKRHYKDEDIIWILNNIAQNNDHNKDNLSYGERGGYYNNLSFYQGGGGMIPDMGETTEAGGIGGLLGGASPLGGVTKSLTNIATNVMGAFSANKGQRGDEIGGAVGAAGDAMLNMIPGVGPMLSQLGIGSKLGTVIGGQFNKDLFSPSPTTPSGNVSGRFRDYKTGSFISPENSIIQPGPKSNTELQAFLADPNFTQEEKEYILKQLNNA